MKLIGIPLKTPSFDEVTAATVMGSGLWLACLGACAALDSPLSGHDAGAALLVFVWGAVGARLGVHVGAGGRHLAVNLLISGALLLAYEAAWSCTS